MYNVVLGGPARGVRDTSKTEIVAILTKTRIYCNQYLDMCGDSSCGGLYISGCNTQVGTVKPIPTNIPTPSESREFLYS